MFSSYYKFQKPSYFCQSTRSYNVAHIRCPGFNARFFHMFYDNEEFSKLDGHFGPINFVQFHHDGQSYASGGEDGYVRINTFDKAYHDFKFEA